MPYTPPFLSNTAGKGPVTVTPWYNVVADYGADPTGVANCTSAFNNAISDSTSTGYTIYVPPGTYNIGAPIQPVTRNGTHIRGEGLASVIKPSFASGSIFTLGNLSTGDGQFITLQNISFDGSGVFRTGGYDVVVSASNIRLYNLSHRFSHNGIWLRAGSECVMDNIVMNYLTGNNGVWLCGSESGIVGNGSYGVRIKNLVCDNPYLSEITNQGVQSKGSWASGQTWEANNIFTTSNWIWQVATGGTSGTTAPADPSATTWYNSNVTATSGTATFRPISKSDLTWINFDAQAYSLTVLGASLKGGDVGIKANISNTTIRATNTYTPAVTIPTWLFSYNTEIKNPYSAGIKLERGYGYFATNPCINGVIRGNGVDAGPFYAGEITLHGGRFTSCGNNGILMDGVPDFKITDNFFARNGMLASLASTFTANDITVTSSANSRGFTIIGNNFGFQNNLPDRYTLFGISVGSSANNYAILGNMTRGNRSGNYRIEPSASVQRVFPPTLNANT